MLLLILDDILEIHFTNANRSSTTKLNTCHMQNKCFFKAEICIYSKIILYHLWYCIEINISLKRSRYLSQILLCLVFLSRTCTMTFYISYLYWTFWIQNFLGLWNFIYLLTNMKNKLARRTMLCTYVIYKPIIYTLLQFFKSWGSIHFLMFC